MVRHDSSFETVNDSEVADAAEGADRVMERHGLALKIAAFYAVAFTSGVLLRQSVHAPNVEPIISIGIWFTVIFALCTALLGGVLKLLDAVQRRRHDYE